MCKPVSQEWLGHQRERRDLKSGMAISTKKGICGSDQREERISNTARASCCAGLLELHCLHVATTFWRHGFVSSEKESAMHCMDWNIGVSELVCGEIATISWRKCLWSTYKTVHHSTSTNRYGMLYKLGFHRRRRNLVLLLYAGVWIFGRCAQSSRRTRRRRMVPTHEQLHTSSGRLAIKVSSLDRILHTILLEPAELAIERSMNASELLIFKNYQFDKSN